MTFAKKDLRLSTTLLIKRDTSNELIWPFKKEKYRPLCFRWMADFLHEHRMSTGFPKYFAMQHSRTAMLEKRGNKGECVHTRFMDFPAQLLRKKCPYSELFWSVFSRIRTTEYLSVFSPNAGNTDQNNSEFEHFSGGEIIILWR